MKKRVLNPYITSLSHQLCFQFSFVRNNSHLPTLEHLYELPQLSVHLTKASLLLSINVLLSWQQVTPKPFKVSEDSLMEDVFIQAGLWKSLFPLDIKPAYVIQSCHSTLTVGWENRCMEPNRFEPNSKPNFPCSSSLLRCPPSSRYQILWMKFEIHDHINIYQKI